MKSADNTFDKHRIHVGRIFWALKADCDVALSPKVIDLIWLYLLNKAC